jgi:hypothetical protein
MKEGFDKEIDSLLRRRARGTRAKSLAGGDGNGAATPASAHLDADELGAFAEGALPAGARLAAVTHIADCDRCRGVVVSLSRVSGGVESKQDVAAAVPASAEAAAPASWRGWMAALFSPSALRYAVPLFAVSLVAVVSFVALRTREAGSSPSTQSPRPRAGVAETQPNAGSAETTVTANSNQSGMLDQAPGETAGGSAPAATMTVAPPTTGRGPNAGEPQPAPVTSGAEDASAPPPPPAAAPAGPEATTEVAKAAPTTVHVEMQPPPAKSDGDDSNKERRGRAAEPVDEVAANDAALRRSRAANEVQMPDGGTRNQKRGADSNSSKTYEDNNAALGATQRESERDDRRAAGGSLPARRGRASTRAEQKTEEEAAARGGETRTAAGHRFRREGSAWVDVNYKPSMRSTGVRRGTEAFRALVADVPVVGRVAGQIAGEVVVVVGGQAYRIR